MLAAGVLLFVYNVLPASPCSRLSDSERELMEFRTEMGKPAGYDCSGYYWSPTSALFAAIGAALTLFAFTESRHQRF